MENLQFRMNYAERELFLDEFINNEKQTIL